MGHEILRNTFFILRGGPGDTKRTDVYVGSLANENGNRASMPDLLHDDQLPEVLKQPTTDQQAQTVEAQHVSGARNNCFQNSQAMKEVQTLHAEVEPAFSQETKYPAGWLVFHSRLGVVHKGVADEYDRRKHHLVGGTYGDGGIDTHVMNVLSSHDSQSPAISNNGPTSIST